jgi:cysteine synthase A
LDQSVIDRMLTTDYTTSIEWAQLAARYEGLFVGISSGAVLARAAQLASFDQMEGKTIVVVLPDSGERYLSTDLVAKRTDMG